jgi:selenocysteine lyase/cysteine desulfurase
LFVIRTVIGSTLFFFWQVNNIVIFGIVDYYKDWVNSQSSVEGINEKPHVITTNVEHDAVIQPIKHLEKKGVIGKVSYEFIHELKLWWIYQLVRNNHVSV